MMGGMAMTPKFLHDEATRYRELAEMTNEGRLKLRLLRVATDYEALARAARRNPDHAIEAYAQGEE